MLNNESKESMVFLLIIALSILIFSFVLFGATGIRVVLGIILVSSPFYLILNNFQIEQSEKFVFSVLLGLALFPSLVYIFGLVVSFRIGIVAAFMLFLALAIFLWRKKRS